jgi:hypothetical protein
MYEELWMRVLISFSRLFFLPVSIKHSLRIFLWRKLERRWLKQSLFRAYLASNGVGMFFGPLVLMEEAQPFTPGGMNSLITTWVDSCRQMRSQVNNIFAVAMPGSIGIESGTRLLELMDSNVTEMLDIAEKNIPEEQKIEETKSANYKLMRKTREFVKWVAEQSQEFGFDSTKHQDKAAGKSHKIWRSRQAELAAALDSNVFR